VAAISTKPRELTTQKEQKFKRRKEDSDKPETKVRKHCSRCGETDADKLMILERIICRNCYLNISSEFYQKHLKSMRDDKELKEMIRRTTHGDNQRSVPD